MIATLEGVNRGATQENLNEEFNEYTLGTAIGFLVFDCILYTGLGLYIDAVRPKEFGEQYPLWFPLLPSFWFPSRFATDSKPASVVDAVEMNDSGTMISRGGADGASKDNIEASNANVEPVSLDLKVQELENRAVIIRKLRKTFDTPDGEKVAVKSLNMVMYEGQIFVLLGHNGAGKTTTISMLTGLIPVTSGDATIRGLSIKDKMPSIRCTLGFCPQHDVLYDQLTVREHLEFYAGLKGYSKEKTKQAADEKIREVGLTEKENVRSKALSGGMKRKLSVGIALMGDSRIVFMDEPTSGMDPFSRRSTWDIIINNKEGRVIVLTTHFMDEADLLGDRIAIMADGGLRCCGSSLFLKKRYGAGYCLTMIKSEERCDEQAIKQLLKKLVPSANVLSDVGAEMSFQMPIAASKQFPPLFDYVDAHKEELGIVDYGISVTTMEEVFLKVAHGTDMTVEDLSLHKSLSKQISRKSSTLEPEPAALATPVDSGAPKWERPKVSASLFAVHFKALFRKRWQYAKRDKQAVCCNTITPSAVFMVGLIILKTSGITEDPPSYSLTNAAWRDYNGGGETPIPYNTVYRGDVSAAADLFSNFEDYPASNARPVSFDFGCGSAARSCDAAFNIENERGAGPNGDYEYNDPNFFRRYEQSVYFSSAPYDGEDATWTDFNATTSNIGYNYFVTGFSASRQSQYGGFAIANFYSGTGDGAVSPEIDYTILQNTTASHSVATFQNYMSNLLSFQFNPTAPTIYVTNYPLPNTARVASQLQSTSGFTAVIFLMIAYSFIPASIVQFVVREKENNRNAKHQQIISGVSIPAYWMSNFAWDFLMYMPPFVLTIILVVVFDIQAFTGNGCEVACLDNPLGAVAVLLIFFGIAIIPFTYCLSYLFSESSKAQTFTLLISIFLGLVLQIAAFVMRLIPATCQINRQLLFLYRLVPTFSLGNGLLNMANGVLTLQAAECYDLEEDFGGVKQSYDPYLLEIIGYEVIYLVCTAVFFSFLAISIDLLLSYPKLATMVLKDPTCEEKPYEDDDDDVTAEAERVRSGRADNDMIVIKGLRKVYSGPKVAVKDLTFAIPKGECFGFLGINGAGKTTSLKILSGDYIPSEGSATLGGYDILTQQPECRRLIGYCPQFDCKLSDNGPVTRAYFCLSQTLHCELHAFPFHPLPLLFASSSLGSPNSSRAP